MKDSDIDSLSADGAQDTEAMTRQSEATPPRAERSPEFPSPKDEPRTALDDLWRELEMDALASDGPIADRDVKDAISRWRPRIEAEAADAPLREALKAVLSLSARYEDERAPKVLWQARAALTARAAATEPVE